MMSYSEKKYGRKIISSSPTYTNTVKKVEMKKSMLTIICLLFLIIGMIFGYFIHSHFIQCNNDCYTLKGGELDGRTY